MLKRLLAAALALMLLTGFALAEGLTAVNDYVAQMGYKAESEKNKSGICICDYIEPAKGAHTLVWSDQKKVYSVTTSRKKDDLKALYVELLGLYAWDSCTYTIGDAVQYAYNADTVQAAKTYKTLTNYGKAVEKYVYGETAAPASSNTSQGKQQTYVLNTSTKKFHYPDCTYVGQMKKENKQSVKSTRDQLIADGYEPCGHCNP